MPVIVPASTPRVPPASFLVKDFDVSTITKIDLDLRPVIGKKEKLAFVLTNVLTPQECQALINLSEETGYSQAVINGFGGEAHHVPGYRDGQRVLMDDREFADELMRRIEKFLPTNFKEERLVEVNERLRFLKYSKPGDKFAPHYDGCYTRPDGSATTLITLQLYLNGGFKGGETSFLYDISQKSFKNPKTKEVSVPVVPEAGKILVFEHHIYHEGSVMRSGTKYTIRLDVLYTDRWSSEARKAIDLMTPVENKSSCNI